MGQLYSGPDGTLYVACLTAVMTGVAVHGGDIYVLEYTNANGALTDGWRPRVRKLGRDGTVTTLATISAAQQNAQPNRQVAQPDRR